MGVTLIQPAKHCDTSRGAAYFLRNRVHRMRIGIFRTASRYPVGIIHRVIWFDHTQSSPLLPMASTGHPSMASLQSDSSSGVVGCLNYIGVAAEPYRS